ncbi:MAG: hypothetical protein WEB06_14740 [Actinomycetota bacterium]
MPKHRDDRDPTEELLAGTLPSDATPAYDRVAAVLRAAGGPPSDSELAGAETAGIRLAAAARRSEGSTRRGMGMSGMWRGIRAKVPNVVLGVIIGMMVGGGAFAVAQTVGNHGGPNPRFHDARVCNLVDVDTLPGNWTHGDYVSAVEKKDPSKVREAAQSDCGKPNKGAKGNKGKGPKPEKSNEPEGKPTTPATKKPSPPPSPTPSPSETVTSSPSPEPSPTEPTPATTPSVPST